MMDAERLQKLTTDYVNTLANSSEFNFVDEDNLIQLTQVHVMLEAIQNELPKGREKRNELSPEARENKDKKSLSQETKHPPVLLSKVFEGNNHLVLLGEPGAGKTTTLNFIALCFAKQDQQEHLNLSESRIPIKVPLQSFAADLAKPDAQILPLLARLVARILQIDPPEANEMVKNWWETSLLIILFDGLDETQGKRGAVMESIRRLAESPYGKSTRIVISSRLAGYTSQGSTFKEYTLKPLQKMEDVENFLHGWLLAIKPEWQNDIDKKVEGLLKGLQAQPALKRLIHNPLILRLVTEQYAKEEKIASNRAYLYKKYVEEEAWQRAIKRGAKEVEKNDVLATLEALAWEFQMGEPTDEGRSIQILQDKKYNLASDEIKAKELLALVREKMGLVVYVNQTLSFSHTTFREFFVAKRLHKAWKSGKNEQKLTWKFLRPRLHLSLWREPLLLFSSLLDEKEVINLINRIYHAKSSYESILYRDYRLAATLAGENNIKRSDLSVLLEPYTRALDDSVSSNLLDILLDHTAIPFSWYASYSMKKPVKRKATIEALVSFGSHAIPTLIQATQNKNYLIRYEAIDVLGQIGDPLAIPNLIEALKDKEQLVRRNAALALGQIGDSMATPSLIQSLNDKDQHVRKAVALALGQLGDPRAVPNLLQSLNDEDQHVRKAAALALGQIGDPRATPNLIEALNDKGQLVRRDVAIALGQIGDPRAIPNLIQSLNDEYQDVRKAAALALGQLDDQQALAAVTEGLKAKEQYVRYHAIDALIQLGAPLAIPILIQALKDENGRFDTNVIYALSQLSDPLAIPNIIEALIDKDDTVRDMAAFALGSMGDPRATPILINAIKNNKDPYNIRPLLIDTLGQLGDSQAIPVLIQALDDRDGYCRSRAAHALGQLGDPLAIPALIQSFIVDKTDNRVRMAAAHALIQVIQKWPKVIIQDEHVTQIKTIYKVAKTLAREENTRMYVAWSEPFILTNILERLESLTVFPFDPLNPPPPPKWVAPLKYAGYAFALMILLSLATLITVALNSAQGTIKGFVEAWIQTQPISVIIALFLTLPLLATVIGITINALKKKLEK